MQSIEQNGRNTIVSRHAPWVAVWAATAATDRQLIFDWHNDKTHAFTAMLDTGASRTSNSSALGAHSNAECSDSIKKKICSFEIVQRVMSCSCGFVACTDEFS